ncbi:MAG: hypothetical protein M3Q79_00750 [bacterium]|nr:hypothetical protein [bacterium]
MPPRPDEEESFGPAHDSREFRRGGVVLPLAKLAVAPIDRIESVLDLEVSRADGLPGRSKATTQILATAIGEIFGVEEPVSAEEAGVYVERIPHVIIKRSARARAEVGSERLADGSLSPEEPKVAELKPIEKSNNNEEPDHSTFLAELHNGALTEIDLSSERVCNFTAVRIRNAALGMLGGSPEKGGTTTDVSRTHNMWSEAEVLSDNTFGVEGTRYSHSLLRHAWFSRFGFNGARFAIWADSDTSKKPKLFRKAGRKTTSEQIDEGPIHFGFVVDADDIHQRIFVPIFKSIKTVNECNVVLPNGLEAVGEEYNRPEALQALMDFMQLVQTPMLEPPKGATTYLKRDDNTLIKQARPMYTDEYRLSEQFTGQSKQHEDELRRQIKSASVHRVMRSIALNEPSYAPIQSLVERLHGIDYQTPAAERNLNSLLSEDTMTEGTRLTVKLNNNDGSFTVRVVQVVFETETVERPMAGVRQAVNTIIGYSQNWFDRDSRKQWRVMSGLPESEYGNAAVRSLDFVLSLDQLGGMTVEKPVGANPDQLERADDKDIAMLYSLFSSLLDKKHSK